MASYQYLIMGTIGATFFVIGVGLLYLMTGTLNIADMGQRIAGVQGTRPVLAALAFLTVGISLKLALFPLHQWLPNAYTFAPSVVTSFLAATATKTAVYVLIRAFPGTELLIWVGLFMVFFKSIAAPGERQGLCALAAGHREDPLPPGAGSAAAQGPGIRAGDRLRRLGRAGRR